MNLYPEIAKKLGVELGQEFQVSGVWVGCGRYVITENGFDTVDAKGIPSDTAYIWESLLKGDEIALPCDDKTVFECPYCGFSSENRQEVIDCELGHEIIPGSNYQPEYVHGGKYPTVINVPNGFGRIIRYWREDI